MNNLYDELAYVLEGIGNAAKRVELKNNSHTELLKSVKDSLDRILTDILIYIRESDAEAAVLDTQIVGTHLKGIWIEDGYFATSSNAINNKKVCKDGEELTFVGEKSGVALFKGTFDGEAIEISSNAIEEGDQVYVGKNEGQVIALNYFTKGASAFVIELDADVIILNGEKVFGVDGNCLGIIKNFSKIPTERTAVDAFVIPHIEAVVLPIEHVLNTANQINTEGRK